MTSHTLAAMLAIALVLPCPAQTTKTQTPKFRLRWGDLARQTVGHTVRMTLPDGATIQGEVLAIEADAMVLDIRKTSARNAWPKGRVAVPRDAVTEFRLTKSTGGNWRLIGTAIGGAAGGLVGIPLAIYGANEGADRYAVAGVAAIGIGAGLGYLAGHSADHKTMLVEVERDRVN